MVRQTTTKKAGAAGGKPPLSYSDYLHRQIGEARRKGERTRLTLITAAARLLDKVGYRDLRVSDVNEGANVSNALFYVYFKNKDEISLEVLAGFLEFLESFRDRDEPAGSAEVAILHGNLRYAQMFKANAGLMRCVFQFSDEFPDFAKRWHEWNARWRDRVVRSISRATDAAFDKPEELDFAVAALGSMVDAFLRLAFVEQEPTITGMEFGSDPERLAELFTRLWVRSLFARDPRL